MHAHSHSRSNRSAVLLSVGSNTVLMLAKFVVWLVTGSVAVLSDAANSAGDLLASAIAYAGVRAAARPADDDHPYGHEKTENLAARSRACWCWPPALAVAVEATRRLVDGRRRRWCAWTSRSR